MPDIASLEEILKICKVEPGSKFDLAAAPTHGEVLFPDKSDAREHNQDNAKAIGELAHKLYGQSTDSVILVLQGMDTSGKDSTTIATFDHAAPVNVRVASFKAPSKRELAHDYLWRVHQVVPRDGEIVIFNRSHYEDVLVVKVREFAPAKDIELRYRQINDFERHLTENGTRIVKCMLNVSYEEQGVRLTERLHESHKLWKFNPGDLEDRKLWFEFMDAYQVMLDRTSTEWAPWYVIPADSRTRRNAIVSSIFKSILEEMNPEYPDPGWDPDDFEI